MRYKVGMPESESSSSSGDAEIITITPRILECVVELQLTAEILRQRNAKLEETKTVPWGSHQHLLRAAISVVRQEADRLERIVDEAPTVESLASTPRGPDPRWASDKFALLQHEFATLRGAYDTLSKREAGLYNEIIAIAKEVGHPDPEACDLGSVLSLIRERKTVQP